jgi:hypothetical protein
VVAGAIAIGAGSVAAGENAYEGNWTGAALDIVGVGLSAVGVGFAASAVDDLKAAEGAEESYSYLSPWFESDAADATGYSELLERVAAGVGGASFGLNNFVGSSSAYAGESC